MGEISLRRRLEPTLGVEVYEVKLGEEFLMSSLFTVAEIELARLGLTTIGELVRKTGDDLLESRLGALDTMEATLDQVLSALNFDFKSMLGKPRQQSLDELFWSKPAT